MGNLVNFNIRIFQEGQSILHPDIFQIFVKGLAGKLFELSAKNEFINEKLLLNCRQRDWLVEMIINPGLNFKQQVV